VGDGDLFEDDAVGVVAMAGVEAFGGLAGGQGDSGIAARAGLGLEGLEQGRAGPAAANGVGDRHLPQFDRCFVVDGHDDRTDQRVVLPGGQVGVGGLARKLFGCEVETERGAQDSAAQTHGGVVAGRAVRDGADGNGRGKRHGFVLFFSQGRLF